MKMQRHIVIVSFRHATDHYYNNQFEALFTGAYDIIVSKYVQIGAVDINLKTDTVRQIIRDCSVTVVLTGYQLLVTQKKSKPNGYRKHL